MDDPKLILINDFLAYIIKERNYSIKTRLAYAHDLERFQVFFDSYTGLLTNDFLKVDRTTIRHFLGSEFENGFSSRTVARRLASLKSFFKYLLKAEELQANPTLGIKTPRTPKSLPNVFSEKLINQLMTLPPANTLSGLCDRAILELFYSTGIRLSELATLNIGDVDFENLLIKVTGKGNRQRIIPFGLTAKKSLEHYLRERGNISLHIDRRQPVFMNSRKKRLSIRTIQRHVKQYLHLLMEGENLGPHTLRHSFATHLMNKGADIRSVKDLLGHSSLSSTQVYTHLQPERMKKIHNQAHPHGSTHRK